MPITGAYEDRKNCSLCRASDLKTVLELPATPLADEYLPPGAGKKDQEFYPLNLGMCNRCGHTQLMQIVGQDKLFGSYSRTTGLSTAAVQQATNEAIAAMKKLSVGKNDLVVEIGSNDGTLLRVFRRHGLNVLGVEPSKTIAEKANEKGIPTIRTFWNAVTARRIFLDHGPAKLIIANNVIGHVPDVYDFGLGVKNLLADDGLFVMEVTHLLDWANEIKWDDICHESQSYHAIGPLTKMWKSIGMSVVELEKIPGRKGQKSIRLTVRRGDSGEVPMSVMDVIKEEVAAGLYSDELYEKLSYRIDRQREATLAHLEVLLSKSSHMIGYGATSRLTTLMYGLGLSKKHSTFIVDDNPRKQRLFSPGLHIPIVSPEPMLKYPPDACIVYAWRFADVIMQKYRDFAASHEMSFVVLMPTYQEITVGRGKMHLD